MIHNNAQIEHFIDDKERLKVEGEYVVIVENENNSEIEGKL